MFKHLFDRSARGDRKDDSICVCREVYNEITAIDTVLQYGNCCLRTFIVLELSAKEFYAGLIAACPRVGLDLYFSVAGRAFMESRCGIVASSLFVSLEVLQDDSFCFPQRVCQESGL